MKHTTSLMALVVGHAWVTRGSRSRDAHQVLTELSRQHRSESLARESVRAAVQADGSSADRPWHWSRWHVGRSLSKLSPHSKCNQVARTAHPMAHPKRYSRGTARGTARGSPRAHGSASKRAIRWSCSSTAHPSNEATLPPLRNRRHNRRRDAAVPAVCQSYSPHG